MFSQQTAQLQQQQPPSPTAEERQAPPPAAPVGVLRPLVARPGSPMAQPLQPRKRGQPNYAAMHEGDDYDSVAPLLPGSELPNSRGPQASRRRVGPNADAKRLAASAKTQPLLPAVMPGAAR